MSPEAQGQLQKMVSQFGEQGAILLQQVMHALRESLALSISQVFFYAFFAIVLAFIINFFLKEVPLRTHHNMSAGHAEKKL